MSWRRWRSTGGAILAAGLLALLAATVPSVSGAFTARVTNTANSVVTNLFFTCTLAAVGSSAYYAFPLTDPVAALVAADVSGNLRPGTYVGSVSHSGSSPCTRDGGGSTTFDGSTGYVTTPNSLTSPQNFSVEVWFRASTAGGVLVGFGNLATGPGTSSDRNLYLSSSGRVVFTLNNGGYTTLTSAPGLADGSWHQAVATLSSAGMRLYVDGSQVGSNTTTAAATFNGYWRVGYGVVTSWPNANGNFFAGQLGYFSSYTSAMSAGTVAAHYRAGR